MCKHENVVATFKTVALYNIKVKNGKAILPKIIKVNNLCIRDIYCIDCNERFERG
jgi:hypothetical protein